VPDRLREYRAKRDPGRTPEPFGDAGPGGDRADTGGRFVIQQHDATRLHWDLRLEHGGTLPSWALPKGVPWTPERDHLAVRTEDHPLEYLDFHGQIPEGQYGAGRMVIWDEGTHDVVSWEDRKVVVDLHGDKARGRYALFATRGKDWMIHRMDPPADPTRRHPPTELRPMEPVAGDAPEGGGWAWEARWRGLRVLVTNEPGDVRMADAAGAAVEDRFPELRRIGRAIGSTECILDGVVVDGGSGALASRLQAAPSSVRRLAADRPVQLVLVDAIWWEGHPAVALPWSDRRVLLESLELQGGPWSTPSAHVGDGTDVLAAARGAGVDALVAKRVHSPYRPGAAHADWVLAATGR
jgi:bifunctional non-homologous end joining protein LigD